jgi:transposase-like protein
MMTQIAPSLETEIAELARLIKIRQASGGRAKQTPEVRARILALSLPGVAKKDLERKVGLPLGTLGRWEAAQRKIKPSAKVVAIRPQEAELNREVATKREPLRLQLGGFRLTIELISEEV